MAVNVLRGQQPGCHVLAIQDTRELDYSAHRSRTAGLGVTNGSNGYGMLIQPVLAVDAQTQDFLGIAHEALWVREEASEPKRERHPIEEKDSMRWLQGAQAARKWLSESRLVTVVADRESDIYEEWDLILDERTHLLTRANHDRQLEDGITLLE